MKNSIKHFAFMLFVALLSSIFSMLFFQKFSNSKNQYLVNLDNQQQVSSKPILANLAIKEAGLTNFEYAAELSVNAVVHVKTETVYQQQINPLYEYFYGRSFQQQPQVVQGAGSGVILSEDGYIVTNNHVIDRANTINVTLNNKKTYKAELIGTDPSTDLALLKIDAKGLPSVNFGNSNELNVGQWVLAVGNPFNLTSTVTAGIISAKARNINILSGNNTGGLPPIESFIQTDAAVNPGNSGGALVNVNGELIGINTAIQSNTGSYTGYSFAIPSNIVQKVVNDLKEYGTVQRAFIGVSIQNIDEKIADELTLNDFSGVYVNGVTKNGSASKAGIKSGDIIKMIDNKKITDVPELQEQISQFQPGDKVNLIIFRKDKEIEVTVTLKNVNGEEDLISFEENKVYKLLGGRLGDLSSKEKKELNIDNGIKVEEVFAGKMRSVGIREGFIITKINHTPVKSVKHFTDLFIGIKGGVLIEGFYESGKREFYGFGI